MSLQNTFDGMQQSIEDLFTGEILVCAGEHELVQARAQEHFKPTENVSVQWLQQTRHASRYDHWPNVIIAERSQCVGREMTNMCVHQENGLTVRGALSQDLPKRPQNPGENFVVKPC